MFDKKKNPKEITWQNQIPKNTCEKKSPKNIWQKKNQL